MMQEEGNNYVRLRNLWRRHSGRRAPLTFEQWFDQEGGGMLTQPHGAIQRCIERLCIAPLESFPRPPAASSSCETCLRQICDSNGQTLTAGDVVQTSTSARFIVVDTQCIRVDGQHTFLEVVTTEGRSSRRMLLVEDKYLADGILLSSL